MPPRPLVGVAVVVRRNGRLLLGKRKNSHGAGCWQFPGGHLEFAESIEQCAVREIFEETGLRIKNLRLGPYTNDFFQQEQKHYITLFVIADYDSGEVSLKEPEKCETWEWIDPRRPPRPLFLPIENLFKRGISLADLVNGSCC